MKLNKNPFSFNPNKTSFLGLFKRVINKNHKEIKRNTKKLVLSSNNYTEYINTYNKIYKINSFHSPSNKTDSNNISPTYLRFNSDNNIKINKTKSKISKKINLSYKDRNLKIRNLKTEHSNIRVIADSVLLEDNNYYKLKYDEKKIFTRLNNQLIKKYNMYITDKINYFKENENLNLIYKLHKSYENEENLFNLNLKSIKFSFYNLTDKNKKPIKFYLPFTYLPLFYYKDFSMFRYILLSLIQFDEEEEKIMLNENGLKSFLKTSYLFKKKSNLKNPSLSINNNENINDELLVDLIGDIYYFIWNTPKYTFKVQILLPLIEVKFFNINVITSLFVHRDLILYLLMNNFLDWDFYMVHYLITYKKFRIFYEKNQSKLNENRNKKINQYMILPKIVNYIDKLNIQKSFLFFHTNEEKINSINIIYTFKLEVQKYQKKFLFPFTFYQSKIISIISNCQNLNTFFLKLLKADDSLQTVTLDYSFFAFFNEKDFKKYFPKEEILNEDYSLNYISTSKGKIKSSKSIVLKELSLKTDRTSNLQKNNLIITNPIFETKQIINNEIECNNDNIIYFQIKIQNFLKLFNFPKEEIPSFLFNNYSSMIDAQTYDNEDINLNTSKIRKPSQRKKINVDSEKNTLKYPIVRINSGTNLNSPRKKNLLSPKRKMEKLKMRRINTAKNYKL